MATATVQRRAQIRDVKEYTFLWEGTDRNNRQVRGEMRAASETVVTTKLRRQGIRIAKLRRQSFRGGRRVNEKDITFFTRQLATMLKAGVPLLQAFEIVARGHSNARFARLMMDIKGRVEAGSSLSQAFREYPGALRLRCTATWSTPAKPPACWTASSSAWRPTRKRSWRSRARSNRPCSIRFRSSSSRSSSSG